MQRPNLAHVNPFMPYAVSQTAQKLPLAPVCAVWETRRYGILNLWLSLIHPHLNQLEGSVDVFTMIS